MTTKRRLCNVVNDYTQYDTSDSQSKYDRIANKLIYSAFMGGDHEEIKCQDMAEANDIKKWLMMPEQGYEIAYIFSRPPNKDIYVSVIFQFYKKR